MKPQNIAVIKIGGSLLSSKIFPSLIRTLSPFLKKTRGILVHGGGREITKACESAGILPRFVSGRRFTDKKTMRIVETILCEKINPLLVKSLKKNGLNALGSESAGKNWVRAKKIQGLGYVGIPVKVHKEKILAILKQGFVPVFASVASDRDGNALNVNADEMASALAKAVRAERLILFTDVPGILDSKDRTLPQVIYSEGKKLIQKGVVSGGMIPKLNSALDALRAGVKEIRILQGKLPLSSARGTVLTRKRSRHSSPF